MGGLKEKCAVDGFVGENSGEIVAAGLRAMENRGSGSSGIAGIASSGTFELVRKPGAAGDVWNEQRTAQLRTLGLIASVGQNRYATSGPVDKHHQPVEVVLGNNRLFLAHNGNISDERPLDADLQSRGVSISGLNDTEKIAHAIASRLREGFTLPEATGDIFTKLIGAFSIVALAKDQTSNPELVAFRDRHGVRPLALGKAATGFMIASETHGLDEAGAQYVRDIAPGEMIIVTKEGVASQQLAAPDPKFDVFELIYFQHPNSKFLGQRIGDIRKEFGKQLAVEYGDVPRDSLVVGVPASALPYAAGYAEALGLELAPAITKNPAAGRTFMAPTQIERERVRDKKYLFDAALIRGRDIILIDDSIVRNTTARFIVHRLKVLGARSVIMLSGSPPIRYPNFYGIDTPEQSQLVAAHMSVNRMRSIIGASRLGFLSLEGMLHAIQIATDEPPENFELSCFTGEYPISIGNRQIKQSRHTENFA